MVTLQLKKIGIAQINPIVGDFVGNAKLILSAYRACIDEGAELVVTPELSLVGYPAGDLVLKQRFVEQCHQALDYLASEVGEVGLIVGHIGINYYDASEKLGRPYRNSASLLHKGGVKATVHKTLMPTYDLYDENKYFEPAEECKPIEFHGLSLGVTIGEDLWCDELTTRPLYDRDPVKELKAEGADVIINMSATPFQVGKPQFKANLLEVFACGTGLPIVYCNAVGGSDQFVFDGHSMILDKDGNEIADFPGFKMAIKVVDISCEGEEPPTVRGKSIEHIYEALVLGIRDYVQKLGYEKVCIGLSGGADSSLTAALAVEALGNKNVIGVLMPSKYSSAAGTTDALKLAENLQIECEMLPINTVFNDALASLAGVFDGLEEDHTEQNLQSRIRGMFLMALANKHDYVVLSTGNKSELFIGNYAVYGDACIGLSVLADVPKKLVYQLMEHVNQFEELIPKNILTKEPSPELAEGMTDLDHLPPYPQLDSILEFYITYGLSAQEIIDEFGFPEEVVRWVQRRVDLNEWKRQQFAPALRVTSRANGVGRRIPIVQRFVS